MATLARAALALVFVSATARAGVIVVDTSGGGDFTLLQPAIDAAFEGDTILVRAPYGADFGSAVDGKSLTIVGDVPVGSTTTWVEIESLAVRNLHAGQQVVVRNLSLWALGPGSPGGFALADNAGSVWIENCVASGSGGYSSGPELGGYSNEHGKPAFEATNCAVVTVVGSWLYGGGGSSAWQAMPYFGVATDAGIGAVLSGSTIAMYETTIYGGTGGNGNIAGEIGDGAFAIDASGSRLLLSGCTVTGGAAGSGPPQGVPGGGVRGDAASTFELLQSSVTPGPGAAAFDTAPGAVTNYAGQARVFSLTSPLRENQTGTLTLKGVPGDFVGFFWSLDNSLLPMPARHGWFLLGGPVLAGPFFFGTLTAPGGLQTFPISGLTLPVGVEAQTFLLQAWFQGHDGVTLSSGTAFTLLDQSF